jgi:hypothetical protein
MPIAALMSLFGGPLAPPTPPPPPPILIPGPDPSQRFASYKVEVAWSKNVPGVAVLDLSTLGGTDLLGGGGAYVLEQFGGPYDDITRRSDNGVRVDSISYTFGRSDDLTEMQALSATITGRDPNGMMNSHNAASPLNIGNLVNGSLAALRPVRVTATFQGVTYPILLGFLRTLDFEPQGRTGTFTMEVTDLFAWLETPRKDQPTSGLQPVIPYTTGITTGAAIGMVLDYIGWTDPNLRRLQPGDTLPFFEATGGRSGLQIIQDLVQASLGLFYIDSAGVAVYADRNSRFTGAVRGAFVKTMNAVGSGIALDTIKNKWGVTKQTRTGPGQFTDGPPQVSEDFLSERQYGERGDTFASPYLASDTIAQQYSAALLAATKDPINPLWQLSVENRDSSLLTQMLALDLLDRVSVTEAETNTQGIFFIEQISGSITPGHKHQVSYVLSDRSAVAAATLNPFILGTDTLDGAKVLAF